MKSNLKKKNIKKLSVEYPVIDISLLPKNSYSEEDFAEVWRQYIQFLTEKGERLQISNLGTNIPKIENDIIYLEVSTKISEKEILMRKEELLGYIRKGLQNYNISLNILVNKEMKSTLTYTPEEKLEKLCADNSYLRDFIQVLDLHL